MCQIFGLAVRDVLLVFSREDEEEEKMVLSWLK